jgi:putative transposase
MARPLRIEFDGAWYHVMNRGAGRRLIFRNDVDRRYFLKLLADISERFDAEIHAYCLMSNHYHLMLRTPEGNLSRLMRHLNGVYTQWHNRHAHQDGALFRGRYKAILVEAEAYWTHLSRYIHRNPLDAGMVKRLSTYVWSSYPAYLGHGPDWLHTRYILKALGGAKAYGRFVEGVDSNPDIDTFYASERQSPILGTERYKKGIAKGLTPHQDIPDSRRLQSRPSLVDILKSVARYYHVPESDLLGPRRGRGTTPGRALAMYLCQEEASLGLKEIAEEFGLSGYASAGASIRNVRKQLDEKRSTTKLDLNYILQDLR